MSERFADGQATSSLRVQASPGFAEWLVEQQISYSFTTYQTNRLFCVGVAPSGQVAVHERLFDKPMGLFAGSGCSPEASQRLYMSSRYQIWQFDNLLAPGEERQGCDRLYVPKTAHTTGDLNVHDVVLDADGELLFVNTDFSCLARLSTDYSFEPIWQPPFIHKLVAEDRCHLNGLAMRAGQPAYVTACSTTDTAAGWRDHRVNGGVAIDVQTNDIIATGLSMPHSPRWYQGNLWLLNSGTGELGHVDLNTSQFNPLAFCPGFVRGLAFWQNFAFVGLSKLRAKPFSGLVLEERLTAVGQTAQCGLMVIDLQTGKTVHWLQLEGVVEELFDVVVLPGVRQPQAMGFQSEDIERLVTFPGSGGIVTTKPTVKRPAVGGTAPIAGLPRQVWEGEPEKLETPSPATPSASDFPSIKFQRVFHLNTESLVPYDPFTYPSLQQRWKTQPQRGELLGTSASVDGEMVAFAIAELHPNHSAELLSLFVSPDYRQRGIATRLIAYLERQLQAEGCVHLGVTYEPTILTAIALEPLLLKLGWPEPETLQSGERRSQKSFTSESPSVDSRGLQQSAALPTQPISEAARSQFNQGKSLAQQGDRQGAVNCFQEALRLQPSYLAAYNQLGNALQGMGQLEEAIATYQQLLTFNPNVAQAHCNLGAIWQMQGQMERAIAAYQQAIQLKPDLAVAHLNLAKLMTRLEQRQQAMVHYQATIQTDPQQIEAHYGLGQMVLEQGNWNLAKTALQQALALHPHHAQALFSLGRLYEAQGQPEAALDCYQTLFDHHPDYQTIAVYQINVVRRQLCDWQDDEQRMNDLLRRVEAQVSQPERLPLLPLSLSLFPATPALHQAVNQHYAAHVQRRVAETQARCAFEHPTEPIEKLRIGYVSPDFCDHPVGRLMQDLFQYHNRDQFTVYAYSLRQVEDEVQTQIQAGCDAFVDLSQMSNEAAAWQIHGDRIHILIDLAGYTTHSRPEIFALRPAPIQCSYLGYPDTTGAPSIDYLVTDAWVVPPELAEQCSEQVIYLPHQFVVSPEFGALPSSPAPFSPGRRGDQSPSPQGEGFRVRADYGLPAEGFIFCCFNAHRKIDPTVFAVWMRILHQVPHSVLWLADGPEPTKANLQATAQTHGIDPHRLVFAPHLSFNHYLARYRCADLFLDTFTYGAGSTAVCALAAGVPLLTRPGTTNASRMGASLCAAAGLELLICGSDAAYEQTAVHLATHPDELNPIRREWQAQRHTLPLFQPQHWMTHLESCCWQLWSKHSRP